MFFYNIGNVFFKLPYFKAQLVVSMLVVLRRNHGSRETTCCEPNVSGQNSLPVSQ